MLPHFGQTWVRNTIYGTVIYFLTSFLCLGFWKRYFSFPGSMISKQGMVSQIGITLKSMPYYGLLMTSFEYMVEKGWTKCFARVSDVGLMAYLYYLLLYLAVVEVGTYWIHRLMHEIKPIYKYIHAPHHHFNKETSLSPFAGWAVHPLDGILMGLPHGIAIVIVPFHFTTHLVLFLTEAIWGVIVHDRYQTLCWPLMGAPYHTIHHTSGHHNYGNFTLWLDQLFGTLRHPKNWVDGKKVKN